MKNLKTLYINSYIFRAIVFSITTIVFYALIIYYNPFILAYSFILFPFFCFVRVISMLLYKRKENHLDIILYFDIMLILVHGISLLIIAGNKTPFPYSVYTVWFWFLVSSAAYFISIYHHKKLPYIIAISCNIALLIGFGINILVCINEIELALFANMWYALFYLIAFLKNQELLIEKFKTRYL